MPDAAIQPAPRSQSASQPQPAAQTETRRSVPATGSRLAWLDALRGIAALCVVFNHLTYSVLQPVRISVGHWFDPGQYGVFVFFLVSGYIVPASLERKGSVRGFFLGGAHRRSGRYALVFAVAAVALGGVLRPGALSHRLLTPGVVVAITDGLIFAGLALVLAGRGRARSLGAVLAAVTGLLVIMFNSGFAAPWESFTIFALMFTGTVLYRAENGQYPWRRALYVVILVFGIALVAVQWHISPEAESFVAIRKGFNSLEFAGLTFAIAMLCRNKKVPRALAWLGLVSYSVYLLHQALLEIYGHVPWTRNENFVPMELLFVAVFVLVLLVCSGLTYRFIEAPMQRLGRRAARRLDARLGADLPPRFEPARELTPLRRPE